MDQVKKIPGPADVKCCQEDVTNGNNTEGTSCQPKKSLTEANNNHEQELRLAFTTLDVDGDGVLSKEEMKAGFKMLGFNVSSQLMEVMFEEADKDGDGVINFTEFCRVMSL